METAETVTARRRRDMENRLLMSRKISCGTFTRRHRAEEMTSMSAGWLFSFDLEHHLID
jgi:hypothetical protein